MNLMAEKNPRKSGNYEWVVVIIMTIAYGCIFIDRMQMSILTPIIAPELGLTNTMIGQINMWMVIAWDIAALVICGISDRMGTKKPFVVILLILCSIFSASCAFATGFLVLVILRLLSGAAEGPMPSMMTSMVFAESTPKTLGRNMGIIFGGTNFFGFVVAALLITQIATRMNWHWAFILSSVPSFIMAFVVLKFVKDLKTKQSQLPSDGNNVDPLNNGSDGKPVLDVAEANEKTSSVLKVYKEVFKYKNVLVAILVGCFCMVQLWIFNVYLPLILTTMRGIPVDKMGVVMAGFGTGSVIWALVAPTLSDRIGRKPTLAIFSFLAMIAPLLLLFYPGSWVGLTVIGIVFNVNYGCFPLFLNIIPQESVPLYLAASAAALSVAITELIGAAIVPAIAGVLADMYGLQIVLVIVVCSSCLGGLIAAIFLKETHPLKIKKQQQAA